MKTVISCTTFVKVRIRQDIWTFLMIIMYNYHYLSKSDTIKFFQALLQVSPLQSPHAHNTFNLCLR